MIYRDSSGTPVARSLDLLRNVSMAELVYQSIHQMILAGEILPGEHVNENRLAAELDVSRSTIREACRHLEKEGLIEITKNKGPFVRDLQPAEALELYDMRAALESLAAELAAANRNESEIEALSQCVADMDVAIAEGDNTQVFEAARDFHRIISVMSKSKNLAEAVNGISGRLSIFRRKFLNFGFAEPDNSDEKAILAAIREGDGAKAAELMKTHLLRGKSKVIKLTQVKSM